MLIWVIHMPPIVLWQSDKLDKLATAKGQMATEVLNTIPQIAAKAYAIISVWP